MRPDESSPIMPIQMVDLDAEIADIGDALRAAFEDVMASGAFVRGPFVQRFEGELADHLGVRHVIGVGNGTDALQVAMMALGIGPGDEVVTSAFTFIATAEAAALLGATPVFADIDPRTFNLDPDAVEAAITERTRAIVPVHLFGQPADMNTLRAVAERHGLPLVEDAAQAVGATMGGETAGTMGAFGCLSFYPSKNLGAFGDGGAILTNDDALAERARMIANHGGRKKYHNEIVGVNSRLDAMQAAFLSVKLRRLDAWTAARQAAADRYDAALADVPVVRPHRAPNASHVFHQYTIRVPDGRRDALAAHLRAEGIPTMVYYPVPLHRLPVFAHLDAPALLETERAAAEVLSLPMHPYLTEDDTARIAEAVSSFLAEPVA